VVTAEKLKTLKDKSKSGNHTKRRNFWVFALGGIFGILVAAFFAQSNDMIDLSTLENMNLENLMDVLPAAFVKDAQQLSVRSLFWPCGKRGQGSLIRPEC
jgi:phospholipid:diacylglycerol acyltransferase